MAFGKAPLEMIPVECWKPRRMPSLKSTRKYWQLGYTSDHWVLICDLRVLKVVKRLGNFRFTIYFFGKMVVISYRRGGGSFRK